MASTAVVYHAKSIGFRLMTVRNRIGMVWILLVLPMIFGGGAALAADIEVFLSADVLQRFLQSAAPFKVEYKLRQGDKAAELTFSNPKVILEPGRPGRIFVALDYLGKSEFAKLEPFQGRTRPELRPVFSPQQGAFKLKLVDFQIEIVKDAKLRLDSLVKPLILPLVPKKPLNLKGQEHEVLVEVTNIETEVTENGIRFKADYRFVQQLKPHAGLMPGRIGVGPVSVTGLKKQIGDCFRI